MSFSQYFSVFDKLSHSDRALLLQTAVLRSVEAGTLVHGGGSDCMGLLLVRSGQLRAYISSDEGKELTLYRLFQRDICLFSASCMMNSIQFDVMIRAEKETEFWIVPPKIYKEMMERSLVLSNYTNEIMASRFTDVMWMVEQVMWKSFDQRLAHFLLEERVIEQTPVLKITHEVIASHLGTAREVVTRMLKYFQTEGMVRLSRGAVEITDEARLALIAG